MLVGLDSNILCYSLDGAFAEHHKLATLLRDLSPESSIALNPTVLHEAYHTLVYHQKWLCEETRTRLTFILRHPYVKFFNQTKQASLLALGLAGKYNLGGRDSLLLANFLVNGLPTVYSHDNALLRLKDVEWRGKRLKITDPIGR